MFGRIRDTGFKSANNRILVSDGISDIRHRVTIYNGCTHSSGLLPLTNAQLSTMVLYYLAHLLNQTVNLYVPVE